MELESALKFLRENQPLPNEPEPELVQRFKEVCIFFCEHAHPECIPLLLNACNLFEDHFFYDTINAVLRQFSAEQVVPHLVAGCKANYPSVRLISADVASDFPHTLLLEPLEELLEEGSVIIRFTAVVALERIGGQDAIEIAQRALVVETDEDVIEILQAIVEKGKRNKDAH